ncbi:MAG: formylglycine-generating enzyme family protein [Deltaproteobacteria bacterium]|jgi:formylglycine-generating enzyme required for sulfatase activity|nr:formylglycine-generating enzyme family protein [Deltaproteobacteria bacterium]
MFRQITPLVLIAIALFSLNLDARAQPQEVTNSIGMEFVLIQPGTFTMGSEEWTDASPRRQVSITKPFYLGKFPVTQKEWETVMGSNPSSFKGSDNPVETISWDDARIFLAKLNALEKTERYRLPTEAQWEYAARAGATSEYILGDTIENLDDYAWHADNSDKSTHPVGLKKPNPWGLYDMIGNVWEYQNDWHDRNYYANAPNADPIGPTDGESRISRGCSWDFIFTCAFGYRAAFKPSSADDDVGFRVAFDAAAIVPNVKRFKLRRTPQ